MKKQKTPIQIAHSKMKFRIDPSLDKYSGIDLCPEKIASAYEVLSKISNLSDYVPGVKKSSPDKM